MEVDPFVSTLSLLRLVPSYLRGYVKSELNEYCHVAQVPAQEIQKHDTLWFEDGNIVIVTGNVGFRVYRGVLARKSAVFRDLFNLPQPPDSEVFEECPVVRLHDPAADMARFLGVLYDGLRSI